MEPAQVVSIIITPIIMIILGSIMFNIYEYLNRVKTKLFPKFPLQTYKQWIEMLRRPSTPSQAIKGVVSYLYPLVYFISGILLSLIIPLGIMSPYVSHPLSLILALFLFITIPIMRAYLGRKKRHKENC
jgi:hypothetical protein